MENVTLSDANKAELHRLKLYFPYRIVFGAVTLGGIFESGAVTTMREPNKRAREGQSVFLWGAKS